MADEMINSAEDDVALASGRVVDLDGGLAGCGLLLDRSFGVVLDGLLGGLLGRGLDGVLLGRGGLGGLLDGLVPAEGEVALASGGVVNLDGGGTLGVLGEVHLNNIQTACS